MLKWQGCKDSYENIKNTTTTYFYPKTSNFNKIRFSQLFFFTGMCSGRGVFWHPYSPECRAFFQSCLRFADGVDLCLLYKVAYLNNLLNHVLNWFKTFSGNNFSSWYRVIQKKLFHENEEKMQEKMKMILQKNENLVNIQQQYGVSFCEKIVSKSGFSWQIWHYLCLIFMILIGTKYL